MPLHVTALAVPITLHRLAKSMPFADDPADVARADNPVRERKRLEAWLAGVLISAAAALVAGFALSVFSFLWAFVLTFAAFAALASLEILSADAAEFDADEFEDGTSGRTTPGGA